MLDKITGVTKVWVNEYGNCSITVSKKDDKGEYENMYIPLSFAKKVKQDEIENGCDFKIIDSWLSFYTKKDGTRVLTLFVNDGYPVTANKPKTATNYTRKGGAK